MMVDDMLLKCQAKEPPVVYVHSTAVLVALSAWNKEPGFCRAIVAIGAPIYLKNREHEGLMERYRPYVEIFERLTGFNLLKFVSTKYPRRDAKHTHRCPQFVRLPFSSAIELRRGQIAALDTIKEKILPPLLYIQGSEDAAAHPAVWELFNSKLVRSPLKMIPEMYEGADHTPQSGPFMKKALRHTGLFLKELYSLEHDEGALPNFIDGKGMLSRFKASNPKHSFWNEVS